MRYLAISPEEKKPGLDQAVECGSDREKAVEACWKGMPIVMTLGSQYAIVYPGELDMESGETLKQWSVIHASDYEIGVEAKRFIAELAQFDERER